MRSNSVSPGQSGLASQYNNLRDDAYGGSELLTHQQGTPNMTLYAEPGVVYIGTTRVIFGGGNSPSFTAPTSHPRIDILTIDNSGTLAITQGTEASSPVVPSYPANKAVLCEIYNRVGETSIKDADDSTNGYIYNDVRPIIAPPYISSLSQVASGLFIPDPGSEAQGDVLYYNGSAWVLLAPGTSGTVLTTKGASANPIWQSANPSTSVFVGSSQTASGTSGATYVTCYTSGTLPAITAGQSMWIKAAFSYNNSFTSTILSGRVQANGTTIASVSSASGQPIGDVVFDAFISFPTNSTQRGTITVGGANVTTAFSYTTSSAVCSSPFTLTFQANVNSAGSQSVIYSLDYAIVYIFN